MTALRLVPSGASAPDGDPDLGCGWNSLETAKSYVLPDAKRVDKLVTALDEMAGVQSA